MSAISASEADRFTSYRSVIQAARDVLAAAGENDKAQFLELCRGTLPEEALQWLDAAFVLSQDGPGIRRCSAQAATTAGSSSAITSCSASSR